MNPFIDTLNAWGEQTTTFAAQVLLQSSLLIAALSLIDLLLRRHVRAVTLYALWLLLPLKLLLPPSLSAPTGIGHWIGHEPNSLRGGSLAPTTLRIEGEVPGGIYATVTRPGAAARELRGAAWLGLGWTAGGVALIVLLHRKNREIRRRIDAAVQPSARLAVLLEDCRRRLTLRQPVELRLIEESASPAVCGWWKPVVLIPRDLAGRLSEPQLRGVMLHELAHVQRGDVLANALQTVLQIVFWWNPLLWLANAHIRHLREQAVDELVVVTLGDDAPAYPETLLEVARTACVPPTAAVGPLGIVESGGALKRRLTRLLERDVPRTARLGFIPTCGIALAGALLLPMARGQQERTKQGAAGAAASPANGTNVVEVAVWFVELPEAALAELRLGDPAVRATNGHVAWSLTAARLTEVNQHLKNRAGTTLLAVPRVSTPSGRATRIEVINPATVHGAATPGNVGLITPACVLTPELEGEHINLDISATITESGSLTLGPGGHLELRLPEDPTPAPAPSREGPVYAVNAIGYMQFDIGTARVVARDGAAVALANPTLRNSRGNRYLLLIAPRVKGSTEQVNPAKAV